MKRRITIPWTRKDSSDGAVYRLFRRVPPPVAALVALAIYFAFLLLLTAQIDSGGGLSTLGGGANHSSIGSPIATGGNAGGLIDILYPLAPVLAPEDDVDGNGLPDSWETQHFGSTGANPVADSDGDGTTNMMEFLAGTNPGSATSVFRPTSSQLGGRLVLGVPTVAGRDYRVWGTNDLTDPWTLLDTLSGDGTTVQWEYPMDQSPRYFLRIEILIPQPN